MGACGSSASSVGVKSITNVISVIGPAESGKTQLVDIVATHGKDDPANEGQRRSKKRAYRVTQQDANKNISWKFTTDSERTPEVLDLFEFGGYMELLWVQNLFRVHGVAIVLNATTAAEAEKGAATLRDVFAHDDFKGKPWIVIGNVKAGRAAGNANPNNPAADGDEQKGEGADGIITNERLKEIVLQVPGANQHAPFLSGALVHNLYPDGASTCRIPEVVAEFEKFVLRIVKEAQDNGLRETVSAAVEKAEIARKKEAAERKERVDAMKKEREKNKKGGKKSAKVAPAIPTVPVPEEKTKEKEVKTPKIVYCQYCKDTKENQAEWNEAIKKSALYLHRGNWAPLCQACMDKIVEEKKIKAKEFEESAIPVGTKVEATIEGWKSWYKGTVEAIDGEEGGYVVLFDDGEKHPVYPEGIRALA